MKMRGKIDEILKQKYDEVEVPSDIFDFDEILKDAKPVRKRSVMLKFAASFIILIVAVFGIVIFVNTSKNDNTQNTVIQANNGEEENDIQLPTFSKEITINNYVYGLWNNLNQQNIYSIEIEKIEQYSTKYDTVGNYSYPITKVKAKVINCFKGDNVDEVEFWVPGGVWTLSDLENSNLQYDKSSIDIQENENIKINYYETFRIADPVVGNKYITCLYEENGELYANKDTDYGFKEFDVDNNLVMNNNKEWLPLDLSIYFD